MIILDEISRIQEMEEQLEQEEAEWTISLLEEGKFFMIYPFLSRFNN